MNFLLDARRTLRGDLKATKGKVQKATAQIELLEGKVADATAGLEERNRLLKEVEELKTERDRLKGEKQSLEDDLPRRLEEAGDAGYNEAGEYYKEQVGHLVKMAFKDGELKGINDTHPSSFLLGYQVGLDYAEVPKDDHRREPPVVPPVQLPIHLLPPIKVKFLPRVTFLPSRTIPPQPCCRIPLNSLPKSRTVGFVFDVLSTGRGQVLAPDLGL